MAKGKYPPDWFYIAQDVKEQAGWKCSNCGHLHELNSGYVLTVHHIDVNPANNHPENLIALCQRCHLHYQHPRWLRQLSFFPRPVWIENYITALMEKAKN